jgi:hypothetical protein
MDIGSEGNSMVQNRIVEPAVLRSDLLMFFLLRKTASSHRKPSASSSHLSLWAKLKKLFPRMKTSS